jgi:hypothetical protein
MVLRNYTKKTEGLFAGIIGKISALTFLQYINYVNEKPIGKNQICSTLIPPSGYIDFYVRK